MVFTCAVHPMRSSSPSGSGRPDPASSRRLNRRAAFGLFGAGAAALALAACHSGPAEAKPAGATIGQDPLGPLYTETTTLVSTYDKAIAANPTLVHLIAPMREDHRQHAVALAALMGIADPGITPGPDPSGAPMPARTVPPRPVTIPSAVGTAAAARAVLSTAEKNAQVNAMNGCLAAPAARAAVLASIAACRATHVAALA
jgi:hypothetical protein